MPRDIVVDACSFKLFYDELIADTLGLSRRCMNRILEGETIIIDAGGQIRHEWISTCCGAQHEFLTEWIMNRILENKIQERSLTKTDKSLRNRIRDFGIPSRDHKYIYLATSNSAFAIVTEDIDFYDPREKNRGQVRVAQIKRDGKGCVYRYLDKAHKIRVFPLELALNMLQA